MGKSNPPKKTGPGVFGRGIAAYRRVLKRTDDTEDAGDVEPNDGRRRDEAPRSAENKPDNAKNAPPAAQPAAGGLRKVVPQPGKGHTPPNVPAAGDVKDSKYRRVAKFLILIGGDEASKILASLEMEQVEAISKEIAAVRGITSEEAEDIFAEFRSILEGTYRYSGGAAGGVEAARRLLYATFGPEKGEAFLQKTLPETKESPFTFLEDFSGEQVAMLLRDESSATATLVLSRLSPKASAAVLEQIAPDRKPEIIKRLAYMNQTSPEVVERVAQALREKAWHIAAVGGDTTVDGMGALTAILKHADISFGDRLISELDEEEPGLGQDIKERLYTLDDVVNAEDKPIQNKLRTLSDFDVAILIKGRAPEFTDKILSNVSANRRAMIREERDLMGPVARRDVDAAAQEFLTWFRLEREEGRILLLTDEDVVV
ncbi:flagellar motor switch protein FliG [Spirochaetia bacterium]|nr:flagellar motor switch protein FliG [Spirochaetia bacterium]